MFNPANELEGLTLDGGWKVVDKIDLRRLTTGGAFSIGYNVENNGKQGFLKALDYSILTRVPPDQRITLIEKMSSAFIFEKNLCIQCRDENLRRVVHPIADGQYVFEDEDEILVNWVDYIIFPRAKGDLRDQMSGIDSFDLAWRLRALHHITIGLQELHYRGIAHQDLKPSNTLVFEGEGTKISDLGSASVRGRGTPAPRDEELIAGAHNYAPPELLYGLRIEDWTKRRYGCDAYLLGSLVAYFFSQVTLTHQLISKLDLTHQPAVWNGTYEEVLIYIYDAWDKVIKEIEDDIDAFSADDYKSDIIECIKQLTNPDPTKRGHPTEIKIKSNQYSLERYVSLFDRLAQTAEYWHR